MDINWYPGHMVKAKRMMEENLKLIDAVIYVLDARAVKACLNPDFDAMIANKSVVYVINKADLVPASAIKAWLDNFASRGLGAVSMESTASKSASKLVPLLKTACAQKIERYLLKGVKTTVKAMVLGVPNCGKSTLINNLCGYAKTVTGDKAGVTRGKQWVRINDYLEMMDTPGTLYPKLIDQDTAKRLAYIGSIKDEVTDQNELAVSLLEDINALDEGILPKRYKVAFGVSGAETIEAIAKARGYILKGGQADFDRTCCAVLDDFRKGRMGKIALEYPL